MTKNKVYNILNENDETKLKKPKYFWKGLMNCYINLEKKKFFRKSEKTYWFVIGNEGNIYFFDSSISENPKYIYNISDMKYITIKPTDIEVILNNKKKIIKFQDIENKKRFDSLYLIYKKNNKRYY
jgi:hypothetical protein